MAKGDGFGIAPETLDEVITNFEALADTFRKIKREQRKFVSTDGSDDEHRVVHGRGHAGKKKR